MKATLYLATVVAALFSLGFATQSAHGQTAGTRVAVIDVPFVLKGFAPLKSQVEKIHEGMNDLRRWAVEEQQKIRDEAKKLQQYNTGSPEYKQTEEKIAEMQLRLKLDGAKREKAMIEAEANAYLETYREIETIVADIAARNQIGLVLRFNREEIQPGNTKSMMLEVNKLVVFQNQLDITMVVLEYLKRQHQQRMSNASPPAPAIPGRKY